MEPQSPRPTKRSVEEAKFEKRRFGHYKSERVTELDPRQPQDTQYVFDDHGPPNSGDSVSAAFKRSVRAAGLPDAIHFHSLRHTFASWLVQDGVSLYQVGKLLGHSTIRVTQMYSHLETNAMHGILQSIRF